MLFGFVVLHLSEYAFRRAQSQWILLRYLFKHTSNQYPGVSYGESVVNEVNMERAAGPLKDFEKGPEDHLDTVTSPLFDR